MRRSDAPLDEFERLEPEDAGEPDHQTQDDVVGMQGGELEEARKEWHVDHQGQRRERAAHDHSKGGVWPTQRFEDRVAPGAVHQDERQVSHHERRKGQRTRFRLCLTDTQGDQEHS